MKRRSGFLLASWIIGALYFVYVVLYFLGKIGSGASWAENLGYGIAATLAAPHIFLVFLALVFNIIGWAASRSWAALTGGILYSVAGLIFILYCIFVVPSIVLSFVGFAKLRASSTSSPHEPDLGSSGRMPYTYSDSRKVKTAHRPELQEPTLFDILVPKDSIREKIFLAGCGLLSFTVTVSLLYIIFA